MGPGIQLRSAGLVVSPLLTEVFGQPDSIVFKHLHVKESFRSLSLQFLIDKQRTSFENSFKDFILETVYWVLPIEELGVRQTP